MVLQLSLYHDYLLLELEGEEAVVVHPLLDRNRIRCTCLHGCLVFLRADP